MKKKSLLLWLVMGVALVPVTMQIREQAVSRLGSDIIVNAAATGNPNVFIRVSPARMAAAGPVTLTWESKDVESCFAAGSPDWTGTKATSGTQTIANVAEITAFSLACTPTGGGMPVVDTATVATGQGDLTTRVDLDADKISLPAGGGPVHLTWKNWIMGSCTAFGHANWTGSKNAAGGDEVVNGITETTTLGLTCVSSGGHDTLTDLVRIVVEKPAGAPSVNLYPNKNAVLSGGTVNLTWEAANADSCTASGGWSGSKTATGGKEASTAISAPTIFKLSCTNGSGTTAVNVPVFISRDNYPITLDYRADQPDATGSAFLFWSTQNLFSCFGSTNWYGDHGVSNQFEVKPTATTDYTIICTGDYGTAIETATVTVQGSGSASPSPGSSTGASTSPAVSPDPSASASPPANTVACDQIHSAADFPQTNNYSPPYNLISAPGENMIKAFCDPDVNVTIQAGSSKSSDYVYDSGYVFRDNQWVQIALNRPNPNVQKIEEHWFNTVATTTFAMPSGKLNSESFFLAFLCHWSDNKWKCGCSDAACATPKWNVQVFQRK